MLHYDIRFVRLVQLRFYGEEGKEGMGSKLLKWPGQSRQNVNNEMKLILICVLKHRMFDLSWQRRERSGADCWALRGQSDAGAACCTPSTCTPLCGSIWEHGGHAVWAALVIVWLKVKWLVRTRCWSERSGSFLLSTAGTARLEVLLARELLPLVYASVCGGDSGLFPFCCWLKRHIVTQWEGDISFPK